MVYFSPPFYMRLNPLLFISGAAAKIRLPFLHALIINQWLQPKEEALYKPQAYIYARLDLFIQQLIKITTQRTPTRKGKSWTLRLFFFLRQRMKKNRASRPGKKEVFLRRRSKEKKGGLPSFFLFMPQQAINKWRAYNFLLVYPPPKEEGILFSTPYFFFLLLKIFFSKSQSRASLAIFSAQLPKGC